MATLAVTVCRRCGRTNEELYQTLDNGGRWAVVSGACACGHRWTVIHTAPANYPILRAWLGRGCQPPEGPLAPLRGGPWQSWRLEGVELQADPEPGRAACP